MMPNGNGDTESCAKERGRCGRVVRFQRWLLRRNQVRIDDAVVGMVENSMAMKNDEYGAIRASVDACRCAETRRIQWLRNRTERARTDGDMVEMLGKAHR